MPEHPWGLISLDWSVAKNVWLKHGRNRTNCEAVSTEGCRRLKAAGKAQRCFIYHNMELALEWEESQKKVMYEPRYADYFLRYHNGTIYNTARAEGDQFYWNFSNPAAAEYFINSVVASVSDTAVDGTFTDDVSGLPAEHPNVPRELGMESAEVSALQAATQEAHGRLMTALIAAGKYNWQAFTSTTDADKGNSAGPRITQKSCTSFMRRFCDPAMQKYSFMMDAGGADNQTIAAFLIARAPISYIGKGWESDDSSWHDVFLLQPGEPMGACTETMSGVFTRQWTAGVAKLDCNAWSSELPFPRL